MGWECGAEIIVSADSRECVDLLVYRDSFRIYSTVKVCSNFYGFAILNVCHIIRNLRTRLGYQKVLRRDFDYSDDDVSGVMEKVFEFVTLIDVKSKCAIVEDDPDDNKIVDCAIESSSEYIVTYDKHLLKLDGCEGICIIRSEEALKCLFQ